jgi:hypothetical protein
MAQSAHNNGPVTKFTYRAADIAAREYMFTSEMKATQSDPELT